MDFTVSDIQTELRALERRYHTPHFFDLTLRVLCEARHANLLANIPKEDLPVIAEAARLHDIGLLAIPSGLPETPARTPYGNALLQKQPEYGKVRRHALSPQGKPLPALSWYAMEICYRHDEQWSGDGYPCGLKGSQIPAYVQVVSLTDCYDTLRMSNSRRSAMSHEGAMEVLSNFYQGYFNPRLVDCFEAVSDCLVADLYTGRDARA